MDPAVIIGIVFAALVAIVVLVQFQIRKQYEITTQMDPDDAFASIARTLGGGYADVDAAGDLSLPFRGGIISVSRQIHGDAVLLGVWISRFGFFAANGRDVMAYKYAVRKIRKAVLAA